jgi:hypothetical protein
MEGTMDVLRGRVGRHTRSGGRQCQNWADDQKTVMDILNAIPVIKGGAGGSLGGRIVLGISSDALYRAISRFEDRHFPGQRSGFIDPGGAIWNRMLTVAMESSPPHLTFQFKLVAVKTISWAHDDE